MFQRNQKFLKYELDEVEIRIILKVYDIVYKDLIIQILSLNITRKDEKK